MRHFLSLFTALDRIFCVSRLRVGYCWRIYFQGSRSTLSCVKFPSVFAFQIGMYGTLISALLNSPTVSGRFRRRLTSHCAVKANSLALDISPFLPESAMDGSTSI